jgi:hypothetical protein
MKIDRRYRKPYGDAACGRENGLGFFVAIVPSWMGATGRCREKAPQFVEGTLSVHFSVHARART